MFYHTYLQYYFSALDVFIMTNNDRNKEIAMEMINLSSLSIIAKNGYWNYENRLQIHCKIANQVKQVSNVFNPQCTRIYIITCASSLLWRKGRKIHYPHGNYGYVMLDTSIFWSKMQRFVLMALAWSNIWLANHMPI